MNKEYIANDVKIAHNSSSGEFLAVWREYYPINGDTCRGGGARFMGRRLNAFGVPLTPSFLIADGASLYRSDEHDIVYNPSADEYLLVFTQWTEKRPTKRLQSMRLYADGQVNCNTGCAKPIRDEFGRGHMTRPRVAFSGSLYYVSWDYLEFLGGRRVSDIHFGVVDQSGFSSFADIIARSPSLEFDNTLTANPSSYAILVTYTQSNETDDIYGEIR